MALCQDTTYWLRHCFRFVVGLDTTEHGAGCPTFATVALKAVPTLV